MVRIEPVDYVKGEIYYHQQMIKELRHTWVEITKIMNINDNASDYVELFETITQAADYHKQQIRGILNGQLGVY